MTNPERLALIEARLQALAPSALRIEDESHLHAGHAGAQGGAGHYRVHIEAECFRGQSPVARHRLVYDRLADLIPHAVHALAIHASAPGPARK
ncbi:BolA family transcriptional regulator [Verticiella sediminum]|uniref:BolA family transcriptional regulator n=1 Tax=Verticiella sediminum TaxID=1247510 RepID=A0A556AWX8_9BURK|nr:BolA family protein [Verticiella sediminum]TSH97452.1 BolA family transcriptional regulator [Verticiella sediminum]